MLRPLFAPFFTSALFAACSGAQPMLDDAGAGGMGGEPWGGAFAATAGLGGAGGSAAHAAPPRAARDCEERVDCERDEANQAEQPL